MKFIAIDGRGGSGKTYLANALAKRLNAQVFHLDEFGNDFEPFVGIPRLIESMSQANADIVIFEGVGVFDEQFDQFKPFRIFIDTSPAVRRERASSRDVPTIDRTADEWKMIYKIWHEAESKYFTQTLIDRADLISDENGNIDTDSVLKAISSGN